MRELRRLLLDPSRLEAAGAPARGQGPLVTLEPQESHYLNRVLRLRRGDRLAVGDGQGRLWSARIDSPQTVWLEQPLQRPLERASRPNPALTLALAVPRRDPEVVWRMATELGVGRLQPLLAERSAFRTEAPLQRWRTIVREACEQSEGLWLPELAAPQAAADWLSGQSAQSHGALNYLATTRRPDCAPLAELLRDTDVSFAVTLSVAIGPEGGWTPAEEELALSAGWRLVSLGEGILRSSTAAVAAISLLALGRAQLRT